MKLLATLDIGRVTSNTEEDYIRIRVRDEVSGISFAELKLTLANLALALTGRGSIPCELETKNLENVGKRRETKRELIPILFDRWELKAEERAAESLKPHEVDGWRGSTYDLLNGKQHDSKTTVTFHRWVKQNGEDNE